MKPSKRSKFFSLSILILSIGGLSACAFKAPDIKEVAQGTINAPRKLLPDEYRRPIQQGRVLTTEQVDFIEVGMAQDEVEIYLGRPLSQVVFNQNRWVYSNKTFTESNGLTGYSLVITFNNGVVTSIEREGI